MKNTNTNERIESAIRQNILTPNLEDRDTEEFIIGFVGPIGSGSTFSANMLKLIIENDYAYTCDYIKLSSIINDKAHLVGQDVVPESDSERIDKLQRIGNSLRQRYGRDFIAREAIANIHRDRRQFHEEKRKSSVEFENQESFRRRHVTIVDSLKNIFEYRLFKRVYAESFILFGVFAPEHVRKSRLNKRSLKASYISKVFDNDQEEGSEEGQQVKKLMQESDFFLRNQEDTGQRLQENINRFLSIIFTKDIITPTIEENAMYAATATSTNSACLSRQVGAVIVDSEGKIIGQGANDVPKFGGGLYNSTNSDQSHDKRCYNWQEKICLNDDKKSELVNEIVQRLFDSEIVKKRDESDLNEAKKIINKSRVGSLIEFSRAVHAEMEAILSVARNGTNGLVGSTMFTTTFPCHSCARHIVAAGIRKVVFIQPYSKSLALELHSDAITDADERDGEKCRFVQYQGVAPKNLIKFFMSTRERKVNGRVNVVDAKSVMPLVATPLDSFVTREELTVAKLIDIPNSKSTDS